MNKRKNNIVIHSFPSHNGFTLAETLITLVIIGVIAALTVPTLINKTQNNENASRVKKAYSVLQNSIHKIALDEGYPQGDYSFVSDTNSFFDAFEKSVSTMKRCKGSNGCFVSSIHKLNGGSDSIHANTNAVITTDGIAYTFAYGYGNKGEFGVLPEDLDKFLGRFWVDVNGDKKPQIIGKDLFAFVLIQGKGILPAGYGNDGVNCNKNSSGYACSAKVIKEGEINY